MSDVTSTVAFTKLAPEEFAKPAVTKRPPSDWIAPYSEYLASLVAGEGARVDLSGDKKATIKNRLVRCGLLVGRKLKFFRTDASVIRFQVVEVYDPEANSVQVESMEETGVLVPA